MGEVENLDTFELLTNGVIIICTIIICFDIIIKRAKGFQPARSILIFGYAVFVDINIACNFFQILWRTYDSVWANAFAKATATYTFGAPCFTLCIAIDTHLRIRLSDRADIDQYIPKYLMFTMFYPIMDLIFATFGFHSVAKADATTFRKKLPYVFNIVTSLSFLITAFVITLVTLSIFSERKKLYRYRLKRIKHLLYATLLYVVFGAPFYILSPLLKILLPHSLNTQAPFRIMRTLHIIFIMAMTFVFKYFDKQSIQILNSITFADVAKKPKLKRDFEKWIQKNYENKYFMIALHDMMLNILKMEQLDAEIIKDILRNFMKKYLYDFQQAEECGEWPKNLMGTFPEFFFYKKFFSREEFENADFGDVKLIDRLRGLNVERCPKKYFVTFREFVSTCLEDVENWIELKLFYLYINETPFIKTMLKGNNIAEKNEDFV